MKILFLFLVAYSISLFGFAQKHRDNQLDLLKATITDAYAGYKDKVKGNEFDHLVNQVKQSRSKDTFALLSQLTAYFRDHHLVLFDFGTRTQKIDTLRCKKDSQMVQRYFAGKKLKDDYEGYWLSDFNYCVIALKKVSVNPVTYYGYVIETKRRAIPGSCVLKMVKQKDGTYFTDYREENFGYRIFLHAKFKDKNTLWVNSYGGKWHRMPNYQQGILKGLATFSYKPVFEILDSNTVLLKMHDFGGYNVKRFDSIVKANKKLIEQANTLIVDIRNNTGGTIRNYYCLFPYIYTKPILHCSGYQLYSNAYIADYEADAKSYLAKGDTAKAREYQETADSMKLKKGEYVYFKADTLAKSLPILNKPTNIAVIINNNCLSAAELMLLNFKQSSKVTLFGEPSGGAVDYLDALTLPICSNKYSLFIATTKRELTINSPSYDATGIKPDVEISDKVTDWIAFVKKYYDERK
jgi:hypothetical protein